MVRLVLLVVASLVGSVALAADVKKVEKKDDKKVELPADLEEILKLVNKERAKVKAPALTLDPTLCKVAKDYSALMARKAKVEHQLDGQKAGKRIEAAGYDYLTVAENLAGAIGKKDQPAPKPDDVVKGWMDSKGHRVNLLNPKHVHTGLGVARSENGDYYFTQLFASPMPADK
jgi:uncharacterized protein YkwD